MSAATTEGVTLHHIIVVGGTTAEWAADTADRAVRLAELGKVVDHVGASWLTVRPFGSVAGSTAAAGSTSAPVTELVVGSCLVVADPAADGRERLARAVAGLQASGAEITEATIGAALNAPARADADLVVVVGAAHRMPPSLIWELAYSELVFVDTTWQHFGPAHLEEAIGSYAHRHRRFGGID
jgi:undecaprenyl diphosphate synthase